MTGSKLVCFPLSNTLPYCKKIEVKLKKVHVKL